MKKNKAVSFGFLCLFGFMFYLLTGCAHNKESLLINELKREVRDQGRRLTEVEFEKAALGKELRLLKGSPGGINSAILVDAQEQVQNVFAPEIVTTDIRTELNSRGLVLIILAEALFVSGSDALSVEGEDLLIRLSAILNRGLASQYILIGGHTDNQSLAILGWKSDWNFSFARALSVYKVLLEKSGLPADHFMVSGFGQSLSRASNDTKEGRRLNRRIEIIFSLQQVMAAQL